MLHENIISVIASQAAIFLFTSNFNNILVKIYYTIKNTFSKINVLFNVKHKTIYHYTIFQYIII